MELVNQTAAACKVTMTKEPDGARSGWLVAKTTWEVDPSGGTRLVTEDPLPLYDEDVVTELGLLPIDGLHWSSRSVEILMLARAYAPRGRSIDAMDVSLSVGSVERRAYVVGDRAARFVEGRWHFSAPVPFETMPLTWERAVFPDALLRFPDGATAPIPLTHIPDLGAPMDGLAAYLGLDPGSVRLELPERSPNVWSTRDQADSGALGFPEVWSASRPGDPHAMVAVRDRVVADPRLAHPSRQAELADIVPDARARAHPGWTVVLDHGALVRAIGVTPRGEWTFALPRVVVSVDYEVGPRGGTARAGLRSVLLLPEQQRVCLVHKLQFATRVTPDETRSVRVRLDSMDGGQP